MNSDSYIKVAGKLIATGLSAEILFCGAVAAIFVAGYMIGRWA